MKSFSPERMQQTFYSSKAKKIGFLMVLIFLSAPYFFLRMYGTDYSQGGSFSLVDVFLVCAGLNMLFTAMLMGGRIPSIKFYSVSVPLVLVGGAFMILSLLSGLEGLALFSLGTSFSIRDLFSGTFQYAFIMIFLPLLASYYLTADKLRSVIRVISLGYLPPMLLTLVLVPQTAPESLREIFFWFGRALGSYGNANSFAAVLMIVLPYYVILSVTDKGFWKAIGYVGVSLTIICLLLTLSFGGMLIFFSLIIANVLFAFVWHGHPINKYRLRFAFLAIFIGFLLAIMAGIAMKNMPLIQENMRRRLFVFDGSITKNLEVEILRSADQRIILIDLALSIIKDRDLGLLWGHGLRQTANLPAFSFAGPHQDVHVVYLLLWIEGGLILLLLFVAYLLLLIRNVMKLAKLSPSAAAAVGSAVLALALFGMLNPHLYLRYFWIPILPAFVNWGVYLRNHV